jgi:hypothetical protein
MIRIHCDSWSVADLEIHLDKHRPTVSHNACTTTNISETELTLHWMPFSSVTAGLSRYQLLFLLGPALQLLHPLIVIVDRYTQDLLGAILANNILIQMLLQHLGSKAWDTKGRSRAQWAGGREARLIGPCKRLTAEVGAVEVS